MINATNEGGGFSPVEAGTYLARCFRMVHVGTVMEEFNGESKLLNKVWISWELPTEQREFREGEGEKPYVLSKEFTLSMHEKATLRLWLENWRGKKFTEDECKAFDITALLGQVCTVTVSHTEKGNRVYANITGLGKAMKGAQIPAQINETFELNYDNFDVEKFKSLPEFIRKKMESSSQFQKVAYKIHSAELDKKEVRSPVEVNGPGADENDDLPF